MTTREFLKLFRKTVSPRRWYVNDFGCIRHRASEHCPLSWLAHFVKKDIIPSSVSESLRILKMPVRQAVRIASAADMPGRRSSTRKALLAAIAK